MKNIIKLFLIIFSLSLAIVFCKFNVDAKTSPNFCISGVQVFSSYTYNNDSGQNGIRFVADYSNYSYFNTAKHVGILVAFGNQDASSITINYDSTENTVTANNCSEKAVLLFDYNKTDDADKDYYDATNKVIYGNLNKIPNSQKDQVLTAICYAVGSSGTIFYSESSYSITFTESCWRAYNLMSDSQLEGKLTTDSNNSTNKTNIIKNIIYNKRQVKVVNENDEISYHKSLNDIIETSNNNTDGTLKKINSSNIKEIYLTRGTYEISYTQTISESTKTYEYLKLNGVTLYGPNSGICASTNATRGNGEAKITGVITMTGTDSLVDGIYLNNCTIKLSNAENPTIQNIICESSPDKTSNYGDVFVINSEYDENDESSNKYKTNSVARKACIFDDGENLSSNVVISNSFIRVKNQTLENAKSKLGENRDAISLTNVNRITIENNNIIYKRESNEENSCGVYIKSVSGDVNIKSNSFNYPTNNWCVYIGGESNSSKNIEIESNIFDGYSTYYTSGVCLKNCPASSNITITLNEFNNVNSNQFSFSGSNSASTFYINYNSFQNPYKLTYTGSGTINYENNYFEKDYDANTNSVPTNFSTIKGHINRFSLNLLKENKNKYTSSNDIPLEEYQYNIFNNEISKPTIIVKKDVQENTKYTLKYRDYVSYSDFKLLDGNYYYGINAFTSVKAAYEYISNNKIDNANVFVFNTTDTYTDTVTINNPSMLYGPNYGVSAADGSTRNAEATISGKISVKSNNVTINGLQIKFATVGGSSGSTTYYRGIYIESDISNLVIKNITTCYDSFTTTSTVHGIIESDYNINGFELSNSLLTILDLNSRHGIYFTGKITNAVIINNNFNNNSSDAINSTSAIFISNPSGTYEINNNNIKWKSTSSLLSLGKKLSSGTTTYLNSCTEMNIKSNIFDMGTSKLSSPIIKIVSLPKESQTNIFANEFISGSNTSVDKLVGILSITYSRSNSQTKIYYNKFSNDISFGITTTTNQTYSYYGNYYCAKAAGDLSNAPEVDTTIYTDSVYNNAKTKFESIYSDENNVKMIETFVDYLNVYNTYISSNEISDENKANINAAGANIATYISTFDSDTYALKFEIQSGALVYVLKDGDEGFSEEELNAATLAGISQSTPSSSGD